MGVCLFGYREQENKCIEMSLVRVWLRDAGFRGRKNQRGQRFREKAHDTGARRCVAATWTRAATGYGRWDAARHDGRWDAARHDGRRNAARHDGRRNATRYDGRWWWPTCTGTRYARQRWWPRVISPRPTQRKLSALVGQWCLGVGVCACLQRTFVGNVQMLTPGKRPPKILDTHCESPIRMSIRGDQRA
eukprot:COSAG02_NODE_7842_length_2823_cov_1.637665_2_plen_190_part_00